MIHLFRPHEPASVPTPPVGTWSGGSVAGWVRQLLAQLADLLKRHVSRRDLCMVLLLLGGVVQVLALAMTLYLIDLTLALFEVWVELARKHLEIQYS